MRIKAVTIGVTVDQIYRAAIETAGHWDHGTLPDRGGAGRALLAVLEQHGLEPQQIMGDSEDDPASCIGVTGSDGIVVTIAGEEFAGDVSRMLREHHWQRAHLVTFAMRSLAIKTVTA